MKKLLIAASLLCAASLSAYASTVTATATDTDGQTLNNCTFSATLTIPGSGFGPAPSVGGVPVTPLTVKGTCSASGVLTAILTDTSTVDQAGAKWVFKICANASVLPITVTTTVIGSAPNLTPAFSQLAPPRFAAGEGAFGYSDIEVVNPLVGVSYFNTGALPGYRKYSLAGWTGGGGGGGAAFPSTAGVVCNTSTTASTNCTGPQLSIATGAIPVMPASTNLLFDLDLHDGSGTTVSDVSGNGNNGTIQTTSCSGVAPTWNANGTIHFPGNGGTPATPYCAIATSVPTNSVKTAMLCGAFGYGYGFGGATMVGSTVNVDKELTGLSGIVAAPGMSLTYGNTLGTSTFDGALEPVPGTPGCFTVVYNTTGNDAMYWNGQLLDFKTAANGSSFWPAAVASAAIASTGNIVIGADGFIQAGRDTYQMTATLAHATGWSTQITPVAVNQAYQTWLNINTVRGIVIPSLPQAFGSQTALTATNFILPCIGDSITFGFGASANYCTYAGANFLSALGTVTAVNRGVSDEISGDGVRRMQAGYFPNTGVAPLVATFFEGTNDSSACRAAGVSSVPLAYTLANYAQAAVLAHAAGYKLFIGAMISRSNIAGCDTTWRDVLVPATLKLVTQGVIDGVFNFNDDARFGADNASTTNSTGTACASGPCFNTDKIHPDTAGQQIFAQWYANFLLAATQGSTSNSPDSITSTTYSMLPQNKWINANPASAAAWNLPDCIALDGLKDPTYRVNNLSASAITLSGVNSETISGSAMVSAGTSAIYVSQFMGTTTGGCFWLRTQ